MLNLEKKNFFRITFLVSLLALIFAYFVEYVLGYQPCNLCLIERIPYMLALIIIIIDYKFNSLEKYLILLLAFVFLAGTLVSLYHLGIEQGFFHESFLCNIDNYTEIMSKENLLKMLQKKVISCKDVTFRIFGFSLTTINIILSLFINIILFKIFISYEKNK